MEAYLGHKDHSNSILPGLWVPYQTIGFKRSLTPCGTERCQVAMTFIMPMVLASGHMKSYSVKPFCCKKSCEVRQNESIPDKYGKHKNPCSFKRSWKLCFWKHQQCCGYVVIIWVTPKSQPHAKSDQSPACKKTLARLTANPGPLWWSWQLPRCISDLLRVNLCQPTLERSGVNNENVVKWKGMNTIQTSKGFSWRISKISKEMTCISEIYYSIGMILRQEILENLLYLDSLSS